LYWI